MADREQVEGYSLSDADDAAARVTGIHSQRRNAGRANLHVDGAFACGVAWEAVHQHELHVGSTVTAALLEELREQDQRWKAREAALSLLATRVRSRAELAARLRRKGFDDTAVQSALADVRDLGLLDDRAFAEAWVRDRVRIRPRGTRALWSELRRKGVAPDIAQAAVAAVLAEESVDDAMLCQRAAEKWLRLNLARAGDDVAARARLQRRLAGYLSRRGYDASDIREALQRLQAGTGT